jgi:hypothetical protein
MFVTTSMVTTLAAIARGSFRPISNAGTALCIAVPAGWILLRALSALDLVAVIAIVGVDEGLGFCSLIDAVASASMALCAGHANVVAIAPSFLDETVVAFGVVR